MQICRYACDNCKIEFGDADHIRVKSLNLSVAYKDSPGNWTLDKKIEGGKELHFCHTDCMKEYVGKALATPRLPVLN